MLKKNYRIRLISLYLVPLISLGFLAPKLYYLQVVKCSYYSERADAQHKRTRRLPPTRGKIVDQKGVELAGSVMVYVPYVDPALVMGRETGSEEGATQRAEALARDLAPIAGIEYDKILSVLTGPGRGRKIPADLDEAGRLAFLEVFKKYKADIPSHSLWFEELTRRRYSRGEFASQIVGYTIEDPTGDNKGMTGVERQYDEPLRGQAVKFRARTNAMRHMMEPAPDELLQSTYGHTVVLTIDEEIQEAAERSLAKTVLDHKADAGIAIAYRVKTGEVLAMASVPTYDLSKQRMFGEEAKRNRVISNMIEPGSVMKIFTFASLFEQGKGRPDEIIDCGNGSYAIMGRVIKDVHAIGAASISRIFEQSSNVGTIKAAQRLKAARFRHHLAQFGFGDVTGIDLPGESPGRLYPISRWSGLSMSSIPMGYELQVTGIQVAAACGALANQGIYMQPHVVKEIRDTQGNVITKVEPQALRRVASPTTCRYMLDMMEKVVTLGTGKAAAVSGYRVGGKSGTTKKVDPAIKKYTMKNYIASFCGVAPISDPEVCIYVYIDNPKSGQFYGGAVAAPAFREIAVAAMKALHIPPDQDTADPLDGTSPSTRRIVMEQIKNTLESRIPLAYLGRAVRQDHATTGSMPELEGLTMKEAQEELLARNIPFEFSGTGVVIEQTPKAYETLEEGVSAHLMFGPESLLLQRVAAAAKAAGALPDPFEDDEMPAPDGGTVAQALAEGEQSAPPGNVLSFVGRSGAVALPVETGPEQAVAAKPNDVAPLRSFAPDGAVSEAKEVFAYEPEAPSPSGGKSEWAAYEKEKTKKNTDKESRPPNRKK